MTIPGQPFSRKDPHSVRYNKVRIVSMVKELISELREATNQFQTFLDPARKVPNLAMPRMSRPYFQACKLALINTTRSIPRWTTAIQTQTTLGEQTILLTRKMLRQTLQESASRQEVNNLRALDCHSYSKSARAKLKRSKLVHPNPRTHPQLTTVKKRRRLRWTRWIFKVSKTSRVRGATFKWWATIHLWEQLMMEMLIDLSAWNEEI